MNRTQWSSWLESSLQDFRLDDNERRTLQSDLSKQALANEDRAFLRNLSFKLVQQHLAKGAEPAVLLRWLERVIKVLDNVQNANSAELAKSWFSPGRACITGIIEQLKLAKNSIDICVFTISDDNITKHIVAAHQRGVAVRVISDNEKMYDKGSDVQYLADKGLAVKIDRSPYHMHHKFAIFDNLRMINGSFNWTRSASHYNEEDITLTDDQRFIEPFRRRFEELWQRCSYL